MMTINLTMMTLFLLLFIISIWKLKPFFVTEELHDDDRTEHSIQILYDYIFTVLEMKSETLHKLSIEELFDEILCLEHFDKKHFWRLNTNRIRHLVHDYYIKYPEVKNLIQMYEHQKEQS